MKSSALRITVEYSLRVSIRYRTSYGVRRTKVIRRPLRFRSAPIDININIAATAAAAALLPSAVKSSIPASRLCPDMQRREEERTLLAAGGLDALPPYSPRVELEVVLPSPPILARGVATPIALAILVPPELLSREAVYLRSLAAYLRSSAEACVGGSSVPAAGACVHVAQFWSSQGKVPLASARNELDSGIWGTCAVTKTPPSCTSCTVTLTHTLEVCAGISREGSDDIQVCQAHHYPSPPATHVQHANEECS